MAADPAVEPFQLLVGEAEIGLADRQQSPSSVQQPKV
jgi:hypothetical protein